MSATINQKTFTGAYCAVYFLVDCVAEMNTLHSLFPDYFGNAPVLEIPGFTHPVEDL
jgi:hypothetical protein